MLKYIKEKMQFLAGVPARDLTDDEIKLYGGEAYLIKSGLYKKVKIKKPVDTQPEGDIDGERN